MNRKHNEILYLENKHIHYPESEHATYTFISLDSKTHNDGDWMFTNHQFQTSQYQGHYGFVRIDGDSLIDENESSTAIRYSLENSSLREQVLSTSSDIDIDELSENTFSYHINVGHGNASIVVDVGNSKIWMIDCSNFDYLNSQSYQSNIDACIKHIVQKFNIPFKIDFFILTHPHFDHYSGINRLLQQRSIDNSTLLFLNKFYSMPSPAYNLLLSNLVSAGIQCVEPISTNSTNAMRILYPSNRLIDSSRSIHAVNGATSIEPNPNNTSTVIQLISKSSRMLFTGDIETRGWDQIFNCGMYLNHSDYMTISHHGSINGHARNICNSGRAIDSVADCFSGKASILMGRTDAYRGIPSPRISQEFNNVIRSEMQANNFASKFVEIEWSTSRTAWYA